jgi:hypothetical protein
LSCSFVAEAWTELLIHRRSDTLTSGETLELGPVAILALMRDGAIASRFESGIDEDAGSHRPTFWYDGIRVRFTCDATGTVVKTSRVTARRLR